MRKSWLIASLLPASNEEACRIPLLTRLSITQLIRGFETQTRERLAPSATAGKREPAAALRTKHVRRPENERFARVIEDEAARKATRDHR
jgi:hypothetical protein